MLDFVGYCVKMCIMLGVCITNMAVKGWDGGRLDGWTVRR